MTYPVVFLICMILVGSGAVGNSKAFWIGLFLGLALIAIGGILICVEEEKKKK